MSQQVEDIRNNARAIQAGLKKMGSRRQMALSVHKTKELVAELEEKAARLVQQLESL
ncbi:MAG: hypothetical protein OEZ23_02920 [Gammaproteobacteria bacterium]|nr:hypothetical protein [Gammaproteobacteria bacterium]